MPIDLTLYVDKYQSIEHDSICIYNSISLPLDQEGESFWQFLRPDGPGGWNIRPLPCPFWQEFGEEPARMVTVDALGEPLTYATAAHIAGVLERYGFWALGPFSNAAHAYLKALRPLTTVVLYWH